ncbi:DUF1360 domain-containing protein [Streptomyces roseifaciens]
MLAKDSVVSPLRAPFTTYQEPAGPRVSREAQRPSEPVRPAPSRSGSGGPPRPPRSGGGR